MQSENSKRQVFGCMVFVLFFMVVGAFMFIGRGRTDSRSKNKSPDIMRVTKTSEDQVNLAWTQSTGPGVDGQYLYISSVETFDDAPNKILLEPTVETYSISPLSPGTSYFAVTAFTTSNDFNFESPRSNVVSVTVESPTPTPGETPEPTQSPTATVTPSEPPGILVNISTRAFVQSGGNVLIAGFIIKDNPRRVIIRAIGPSLSGLFPVVLTNPFLELRDNFGALIDENDNWRDEQEAEIIATNIPPSHNLESAIVRILAPGSYTAIVSGVDNRTGVALVEVYAIENP